MSAQANRKVEEEELGKEAEEAEKR